MVYKISCNNCDQVYYGQTSRVLKDRVTQHKSDIKFNKQPCTLAEHRRETGHHPNFNNIKVIHSESHYHKRSCLEMFETALDESSLNIKG